MKNIKAIIFDAYGTLFDVNSAAEKCKGKIGDKWEGFANGKKNLEIKFLINLKSWDVRVTGHVIDLQWIKIYQKQL